MENKKNRRNSKILENAKKRPGWSTKPTQDTTPPVSFSAGKTSLGNWIIGFLVKELFQEVKDEVIEMATKVTIHQFLKAHQEWHSTQTSKLDENEEASHLIPRKEAAFILGVHPKTIDNWARREIVIPVPMPSGQSRFRRSEIVKLAEGIKESKKRKNKQKGEDES